MHTGHYVSDVYDMKKQSWLTYNDLDVSRTQESAVQKDRDRSGYIFFYMQRLASPCRHCSTLNILFDFGLIYVSFKKWCLMVFDKKMLPLVCRELFEELERRGGSGDTGRAVLQPL